MQTWIQHNYINLQYSPLNVLHAPSSIPLRCKFLGRKSLFVAVPASRTLPTLPPRPIWSDVHAERLLGAKRDENRWVPNLMNMAVGGNTSNLNPEFAARCEGRALACYRHTPEDTKPWHFFFSNCWLKLIPKHITVPFTVKCLPLLQVFFENRVIAGCPILRVVYNIPVFHLNHLCNGRYNRWRVLLMKTSLCHFLQSDRFKCFPRQYAPKRPAMHNSEPNALSFTQEKAAGLYRANRAPKHPRLQSVESI